MNIFLSVPENGKIIVSSGQNIDFETKIFEIKKTVIVKVDIKKNLGISPQNVFSYLKKFIGEKIKKGDILALKKGLFSTKKIKSEWDGVIKEIDHNLGILTIETNEEIDQEKKPFFSPVCGEIERIEKDGVIIKIKKKEEINLKEESKEIFGAKIFILENENEVNSENVENRLIIAEQINSIFQTKLEALGAKGFLTIKKLSEETNLPAFQFKNLQDINKIKKNWYCFVDKNSSKIIFYESTNP